MNAAELVRDYGYYAVAVGTFFEGEMVMLAAGLCARAGMLTLPGILVAGMAGIFASDTTCFFIGRLAGGRIERWFPKFYRHIRSVLQVIERHDSKLLVYFQFFPGLCTATPMAFGMSRISVLRFMALDLVGNVLWTVVFCVGGYLFGAAFERVVATAHHWQTLVGVVVLVLGVSAWLVWRWWARRLFAAR